MRIAYKALELSEVDFAIIEGVRTHERQKELVEAGKSWTMNSYHLKREDGYGRAIDFMCYVDGKGTWDIEYYHKVAYAFYRAADILNENISSGINWKSVDGPHIQLEDK